MIIDNSSRYLKLRQSQGSHKNTQFCLQNISVQWDNAHLSLLMELWS